MAEAVGLAASIAGLVAIASSISKALRAYVSEVANARKDIERLISEISLLAEQLEPLSTPIGIRSISNTGLISQLVGECTSVLGPLKEKLQRQSKGRSHGMMHLKWPRQKMDFLEEIEKIRRLKDALILGLQA